jgi:hypothetical protein
MTTPTTAQRLAADASSAAPLGRPRSRLPPRGAPDKPTPPPGQAESQYSSGAGLCGQGHALRCAPGGARASLDRAHPTASHVPAAWPESGLGQG